MAALGLATACGDDSSPNTTAATTMQATTTATMGTPDDGVDDGMMDADSDDTMGPSDNDAEADMDMDMDAEATADAEADMDMDMDATGPGGDAAVFRFASINVRDPHFFGDVLILGCTDLTDSAPAGNLGVNEQFNQAINMDLGPMDMPDGNLDLSLMLIFPSLDQADGAMGDMDFANGTCPVGGGDCGLLAGSMLYPSTYTSSDAGPCENVVPAELSNYTPAPGTTPGPCFSAGPATVEIVTESFSLTLEDTEIAGTYQGDPATSLMSGTLRGFLSTATAEATILPMDLQDSTGAMNVAGLLPGGAGNCDPGDDTDGDGWWFYADFTALGSSFAG
ncbi:MAG: hypothetical protein AAF721_20385 [Myxococcota bacterium]